MTLPYLMKVPLDLESAVRLGSAYVKGAMVKDGVTHQVLGHLQPTASFLTQALSSPLKGFLAPLEIASSLGQNWQLWKVRQMLDTLQTVASIGTAASVLNLGVSAGGFALVLRAINKVDGKVDRVLQSLDELKQMHKGDHRANVRTVLERAAGSFELSPADAVARWDEVDAQAHAYSNVTLDRLKGLDIVLDESMGHDRQHSARLTRHLLRSDGEAGVLLTMLMHLTSVRSEALLCLQRPGQAADLARAQAGWLAALPTDPEDTTRALVGDDVLPRRHLKATVEQAVALTTWASLNRDAAHDRAMLCASLAQHQVDCAAYVRMVRDHAEPTLLFIPHGEEAMRRFGPKEAIQPVEAPVPEVAASVAVTPVEVDPVPGGGPVRRILRSLGSMFGPGR